VAEPRESQFEERISKALVDGGFLGVAQLERAQQVGEAQGGHLLENLVTLGMVARGILLTMMGLQLRVPVEDLQDLDVASEAAELLPQEIAREHRLVPLGLEADSSLRLAVSHPHEREGISQLASITGRRVRVVLALGGDIDELIERVYRSQIGSEPQPEPVVFYEGTVSITAQYTANLQTAVEFVQWLRETPRLRLLRFARQPSNDVQILLCLREPMDLKAVLERMPCVTEVNLVPPSHSGDGEPVLVRAIIRGLMPRQISALRGNSTNRFTLELIPTFPPLQTSIRSLASKLSFRGAEGRGIWGWAPPSKPGPTIPDPSRNLS
jgi:hypothetical protein